MLELIIKAVIAYLLGSANGSLLIGKFYYGGVDIRNEGSRNAGGTNALRTHGVWFALGATVIDVLKGAIAAGVLPAIFRPGAGIGGYEPATLAAVCGFAAIIGHIYPVWFGFRGGKGVATLVGVLLVLAPYVLLVLVAAWVMTLLLSGYVGLASVVGSASTVPASLLFLPIRGWAVFWFCLASAALIIFTHRDNLMRIRDGTEHRFESIMLMRR